MDGRTSSQWPPRERRCPLLLFPRSAWEHAHGTLRVPRLDYPAADARAREAERRAGRAHAARGNETIERPAADRSRPRRSPHQSGQRLQGPRARIGRDCLLPQGPGSQAGRCRDPQVSREPPARRSGQITFGCLNTPAKVSEEVLALWSRVLSDVPGSRLLLRTGAGRQSEARIREILAALGVSPGRLLPAGRAATRFDYLKLYDTVDIALDPFPYNGVTTTCDSLWMGVPAISLAGRMNVSRQGVRFLRSVGLEELLAETPEDYVRIATDLAGDLPRLSAMRSGLRERMRHSPLLTSHRLTRALEAAYLAMWQKRIAILEHPREV
jgi:Glycosyl transferase family 41